jgi:UDP-N-acetylglucosamine acyltransferase
MHSTNSIHMSSIIYDGVKMGRDNWVAPYSVIGSPGEIRNNKLLPASECRTSLDVGVIIGDRNVIREFSTIQAGATSPTKIGNDCYIMTKTHIAHDAVLKNGVTVSSSAVMGGHSIIGDNANVGLNSVLHQHTVIGDGVMIGMGSVLKGGVPPFMLGFGNPFRIMRVNSHLIEKLQLGKEINFLLNEAVKAKSPTGLLQSDSLSFYLNRYISDCESNDVDPWANLMK